MRNFKLAFHEVAGWTVLNEFDLKGRKLVFSLPTAEGVDQLT